MFRIEQWKIKKQNISHNNDTCLGHPWLGHINLNKIERLAKDGLLKELTIGTLLVCEFCLEDKMTKRPFIAKGQRAKELLELIHSDVYDPMSIQARCNYEYLVTFINDYSRLVMYT